MNQLKMALFAGIGAFMAIGLLSFFEANLLDVALLMAPFGATAVLVFGVPDSPLAQPKNVIVGHVITASVGLIFTHFIGVTPFTLALASGVAVSLMLLTKTTHPPAGANPILIMITGQSWGFLITPVLLGALLIVLVGKLMQGVKKRYLLISA